jgi:hypothetical protein
MRHAKLMMGRRKFSAGVKPLKMRRIQTQEKKIIDPGVAIGNGGLMRIASEL